PWTRLVMGKRRVAAVEVEDLISVDPVRCEAGLAEGALHIRSLAREVRKTVKDQRKRVQRLAALEAITCDQSDSSRIHAAGDVCCGAPADALAHRSPQPVEELLAKLRHIVGARIDPALQPIPIAALLHLAAGKIEGGDAPWQHA